MKSRNASPMLLIGLVLAMAIMPARMHAQVEGDAILVGKVITLNSNVLQEERPVYISLPLAYDRTEDHYPVIYVLDGGGNFGFSAEVVRFLSRGNLMSPAIVVGIPNTDRTRDLTPVREEKFKNTGGASQFIRFLSEELMPYVERNYRTHPYRILFGHSLGGMFSIYTLFAYPELFQAHIAVSPYLMFDNGSTLDVASKMLEKSADYNHQLFISVGNEPDYKESLDKFKEILNTIDHHIRWTTVELASEDHGTVPLKSFYQGLEFIYDGWRVSLETAQAGRRAIEHHFDKLSEKFGYSINPSEVLINQLGYVVMTSGNLDNAIGIFKMNVEKYPNSANVYDSLGEAFEKNGELGEAKDHYDKACKKGEENNDPNLNIYTKNRDRIYRLLTLKN